MRQMRQMQVSCSGFKRLPQMPENCRLKSTDRCFPYPREPKKLCSVSFGNGIESSADRSGRFVPRKGFIPLRVLLPQELLREQRRLQQAF